MLITVLLLTLPAQSTDRPITGEAVAEYTAIDPVIERAMDAVGATAASVAVYRGETELLARSYGWFDNKKRKPVEPIHTFRLASNSKPFVATAAYTLIETTDLELDTPVLSVIDVRRAAGNIIDPRWRDVTVEHLLEHRGGWDREATFDPMYRFAQIQRELHIKRALRPQDIIAYMLGRKLDFTPDDKRAYSNFGYLLLGQVVADKQGESYEDAVQALVAAPLGIDDLAVSNRIPGRRPKLEVDYPNDSNRPMRVRAAPGGMTASPRSLCKLLAARWVVGTPRHNWQRMSYYHYGSLPDTTMCLMIQRIDGINWAAAFNARRNENYNDDLATVHQQIDAIIDESVAVISD